MFVEAIECPPGLCSALQLNDDAHSAFVRFISQVADLGELARPHQIGDLLDEAGFVDLVGDFGDHDAESPAAHFFIIGYGADGHFAPSGRVGFDHALLPQDHAAGGEIGAFDVLHQGFHADLILLVPVIQQVDQGIHHFPQVVRGDVGRHAHGDAGGAVHQQVGQAGGQDGRLLEAAVEVVGPFHGVLFNIGEHLHRQMGEPRFGVAHRRRGIAVN